jgi:hypothetical protein
LTQQLEIAVDFHRLGTINAYCLELTANATLRE